MKNFNLIIILFSILLSIQSLAQKYIPPIDEEYIVSKEIDENGKELIQIRVPGSPPPPLYRASSAADPDANVVTILDVPAMSWCFGCSPTAAAMLAGYYDRNGYPNMYAGPTNGGVFPLNNSSWGTATINGELRDLCPLSATRNGLDGRVTRGHVDDYWFQIDNPGPDPYFGHWTEHSYDDCTADYMKTSQSAYGNPDGSTSLYFYTSGAPYTATNIDDGGYGFELFVESRGYSMSTRFNQLINGYDTIAFGGFTFADYKNEIDANRPVMIHVEGHTMLGVGYDDDGVETVYLHNTWDYNLNSMTWGDEYYGMQHYMVSVFELAPTVLPNYDLSSHTYASGQGDCFNATQDITVAENGPVVFQSGSFGTFIAGGTITFYPGFHAQSGSDISAYIGTTFCASLIPPIVNNENNLKNIDIDDERKEDNLLKEKTVKVYPNPNNGKFNIALQNFEEAAHIQIFNSIGTVIYKKTFGNGVFEIDLPELNRGIYFVSTSSGKTIKTNRIIIQ